MPKINGTPISLRKNYKVKIILITESRSTLLDMVSMSASLKKNSWVNNNNNNNNNNSLLWKYT